jgi:hypothetical protein
MSMIHAINSAVSGGRARPQDRCAVLAIECAFSDGGRFRSGDLIQCGPALT